MEFEQYIYYNGKKLRRGYTTGSCAAAATGAAMYALYNGVKLNHYPLVTPNDIKIDIPIKSIEMYEDTVVCTVIKDGGDDIDVTNGIEIVATVRKSDKSRILAGEGIGIVTKPGLKVEVGKPAINPVPLKMIEKEMIKFLPTEVTISVPNGLEISKKTFNSKLGIVGGISILGTTGIVEPMSEDAIKESLELELSVLKASGKSSVVFVMGSSGEKVAVNRLGLPIEYICTTSNYIGFMLDKALEFEVKKVLLIGHIGKFAKLSAGIFNTHNHIADARAEIITAYAATLGANIDVVNELMESVTAEHSSEILKKNNLEQIFDIITNKAVQRCNDRIFGKIECGIVLFSNKEILSIETSAKRMIEELKTLE